MSSLFVIGNGFDLAHEMKTEFNEFRDYLSTKYSKPYDEMLYVPESVIGHHGEELQSDDEVAGLIAYLLNEVAPYDNQDQKNNWNTIEELLGRLNLPECFDNVEPQYDTIRKETAIIHGNMILQNQYVGIWH